MIKVAAALNSFASQEASAPPSEKIFVLSACQLEAIVAQAIERATAPLAARLDALERGVGCRVGGEDSQDGQDGLNEIARIVQNLQEENRGLKRELEAFQEYVAQERAFDRQRISMLERAAPTEAPQMGTKTAARIDRIRVILKMRGGTVSFKELRRELQLKSNQFSALIARLDKRSFQVIINPRARDEKALRLRAFT